MQRWHLDEDQEDALRLGELLAARQAGPEEQVSVRLTREALNEPVAQLPALERDVVRLRYGIDGGELRRGERSPVSSARSPTEWASWSGMVWLASR